MQPKQLKILQVSGGKVPIPPAGAFAPEHVIHELCTELTELGHKVTLLDARGSRPPVPYQVIEVPAGPRGNVSFLRSLVRGLVFGLNVRGKLQELLRNERFDVVTFHYQFPALFGMPIARRHNVATIFWPHAHHWGSMKTAQALRNRALYWAERRALRSVDRVVVMARGTGDVISNELGLPPDQVEVLPYGLANEWFLPPSAPSSAEDKEVHVGNPLILNVGIIDPRKNQEALIKAIPIVSQRIPEARFAFAGPVTDKRYFERLQRIVRETCTEERTCFLGDVPRDQIHGLYHKASLFVFTSLAESTGIVLLEAMACRLPILLASATEAGQSVPASCAASLPAGSHGDLGEAIVDLLLHSEKRDRLADAGWRYTNEVHRRPVTVARLEDLYLRVAQSKTSRSIKENGGN